MATKHTYSQLAENIANNTVNTNIGITVSNIDNNILLSKISDNTTLPAKNTLILNCPYSDTKNDDNTSYFDSTDAMLYYTDNNGKVLPIGCSYYGYMAMMDEIEKIKDEIEKIKIK